MTETAAAQQLDLIRQGIDALFAPGDVVELRVPKAKGGKKTISGYFVIDEEGTEKLIDACSQLSGKHDGIYYLLNPCKPALLARSMNRIKSHAEATTQDGDILKRQHFLIDLDPVRPTGISATDEEVEYSRSRARQVYSFLVKECGWPALTVAASGNGTHLIPNIDLPNTKESNDLIKTILSVLAARFDDDCVKVDRTVFNASRITKAYGTMAGKGDDTTDRPHRQSSILTIGIGIVTFEQLQAIAALAALAESAKVEEKKNYEIASHGDITDDKMEEFFEFHSIAVGGPGPGMNGGTKWVLDACPFNPEHKGKDAACFLTDGKPGFKCLHSSCTDNHWKEFRIFYDAQTGAKFPFWSGDYKPAPTLILSGYNKISAELKADLAALADTPPFDPNILEGTWIGEMAKKITEGSETPPQFAYHALKVGLGALVDRYLEHPTREVHMRHYTMSLAEAGVGKSDSVRRVFGLPGKPGALTRLLDLGLNPDPKKVEIGGERVKVLHAPGIGSGENLVAILSEWPHQQVLIEYDEMSEMWKKAKNQGSTLNDKFLSLYEQRYISASSCGKGSSKAEDVGVSLYGCFVPSKFVETFAGSGAKGDGLLSRFTFGFSEPQPCEEKFKWNPECVADLVADMEERIVAIRPQEGHVPDQIFVPTMTPEAKHLHDDFLKEFMSMHKTGGFATRLDDHFCRDLMLRCFFSEDTTIFEEQVERSISWVEHQLAIRKHFWDEDAIKPIDAMAKKITGVLQRHGRPEGQTPGISRAHIVDLCNVIRDGRHDDFRRAMNAMGQSGSRVIEVVARNRKGEDLYAMTERTI